MADYIDGAYDFICLGSTWLISSTELRLHLLGVNIADYIAGVFDFNCLGSSHPRSVLHCTARMLAFYMEYSRSIEYNTACVRRTVSRQRGPRTTTLSARRSRHCSRLHEVPDAEHHEAAPTRSSTANEDEHEAAGASTATLATTGALLQLRLCLRRRVLRVLQL
jgi:hypothetical protein